MKNALYLENKKWDNGWVGYLYANEVKENDSFTYVKDGTDQFGKPVKVYSANNYQHLDTPGGVMKTDLVVLIED